MKLKHFVVCFTILCGLAFGQKWPSVNTSPNYVDAYSPVFTAGTSGDMCKAINNAIATAQNSSAHTSMVVDARSFTGVRACLSNPFHGYNVSVKLLLGANTTILTSTTWYSPAVTHRIEGELAGNVASSGGTTLAASGPLCNNLPNTTWSSPNCTVTDDDGNVVVVPQLIAETGNYPLPFGVKHGPAPSGTYYPLLVVGGEASSAGGNERGGFEADGDAWVIEHMKFEFDGATNIIGVYSNNNQERTILRDIRIGFACGTATVAPVNCFAVFGDRAEYSAGTMNSGSPTRSGSTRMVVEHLNMVGEMTNAADCTTCGVLVYEGSPITIDLSGTGCSGSAAYVKQSLAGGVFTPSSPDTTDIAVSAQGSGCSATIPTACHISGPAYGSNTWGTDNTSAW